MESMDNKVIHLKTHKEYEVLTRDLIECTEGREGKKYVLYFKNGKFFCCEQEEFDQKFQSLSGYRARK